MAHIEVTDGHGVGTRIELEPGQRCVVGRGDGRTVDLVLSQEKSLSRQALAMTLSARRALDVAALQSVGSVTVYRDDGTTAVALRRGERALLTGTVLDIVVYSGAGMIGSLRYRSDGEQPAPTQSKEPEATARRLSVWEALNAPPSREWVTVAALAAVLTRRAKRRNRFGQPMRKELSRACGAWFGLPTVSAGQLTTWLDKALAAFGLTADGDKTGVVGEYMVASLVLTNDELDMIEAELAERD